MALRIEDYALIGDCRSAALVGVDGSIDWLAFPRFDSAACFAALLGTPDNGRWIIAPTDIPVEVRRRYRPGTLILETEFETKSGKATLIDFMPPADGRGSSGSLSVKQAKWTSARSSSRGSNMGRLSLVRPIVTSG